MLVAVGIAAALSVAAASAYAQSPRSRTVGVTKDEQKVSDRLEREERCHGQGGL